MSSKKDDHVRYTCKFHVRLSGCIKYKYAQSDELKKNIHTERIYKTEWKSYKIRRKRKLYKLIDMRIVLINENYYCDIKKRKKSLNQPKKRNRQ